MMLAGRVLMGLGFAAFGLWNIGNHAALKQLIDGRRVPLPGIIAALGIATQIGAGLLLAAGAWTRLAALALVAFVIGATLLAHLPLGVEPLRRRENGIACLMNVIVVGGLLASAP
jgi:putative oxidoreductase